MIIRNADLAYASLKEGDEKSAAGFVPFGALAEESVAVVAVDVSRRSGELRGDDVSDWDGGDEEENEEGFRRA